MKTQLGKRKRTHVVHTSQDYTQGHFLQNIFYSCIYNFQRYKNIWYFNILLCHLSLRTLQSFNSKFYVIIIVFLFRKKRGNKNLLVVQ